MDAEEEKQSPKRRRGTIPHKKEYRATQKFSMMPSQKRGVFSSAGLRLKKRALRANSSRRERKKSESLAEGKRKKEFRMVRL